MAENQMEDRIDLVLIFKHYYKNRRLLFRVLVLSVVLSIVFSMAMFILNPPIYEYTSQSVIDMTIDEEAQYQQSIFISYLVGQRIFEESAESIGLAANYASWRNSIVIENIPDTSQIIFKISASKADKLVELNRRIVSNAIFQSNNILTGIRIQTLEEAELLDNVREIRRNVSYLNNLLIFITFGLISAFGWLTFQTIIDRRIKYAGDIEEHTHLVVIGTIPDFENLSVNEEINLSNFIKGLIWTIKK